MLHNTSNDMELEQAQSLFQDAFFAGVGMQN